jgi:hypothetical protein
MLMWNHTATLQHFVSITTGRGTSGDYQQSFVYEHIDWHRTQPNFIYARPHYSSKPKSCSSVRYVQFVCSQVHTQPKPSDFWSEKILSTPSFGGKVKPPVPCCSFTACKRPLNVMWKSAFRQNLPDTSRTQLHLLPLGALAWWRLVAKVGTSNQDRTISLKAAVRIKKK